MEDIGWDKFLHLYRQGLQEGATTPTTSPRMSLRSGQHTCRAEFGKGQSRPCVSLFRHGLELTIIVSKCTSTLLCHCEGQRTATLHGLCHIAGRGRMVKPLARCDS
eukprot:5847705-Amphidinium_carterae.1